MQIHYLDVVNVDLDYEDLVHVDFICINLDVICVDWVIAHCILCKSILFRCGLHTRSR